MAGCVCRGAPENKMLPETFIVACVHTRPECKYGGEVMAGCIVTWARRLIGTTRAPFRIEAGSQKSGVSGYELPESENPEGISLSMLYRFSGMHILGWRTTHVAGFLNLNERCLCGALFVSIFLSCTSLVVVVVGTGFIVCKSGTEFWLNCNYEFWSETSSRDAWVVFHWESFDTRSRKFIGTTLGEWIEEKF